MPGYPMYGLVQCILDRAVLEDYLEATITNVASQVVMGLVHVCFVLYC